MKSIARVGSGPGDGDSLEAYYRDLGECSLCPAMPTTAEYLRLGLHRTPRMDPLPAHARVLLVFESPGIADGGAGRTGKLTSRNQDASAVNLRRFLTIAGLTEADVFYTNAVACPAIALDSGKPSMRPPTAAEVSNCRTHVTRLARIVGARVIGGVGAPGTKAVLGRHAGGMKELYVEFLRDGPRTTADGGLFVPLFHTGQLGINNVRKTGQSLRIPDLDERLWRQLGEVVRASERSG